MLVPTCPYLILYPRDDLGSVPGFQKPCVLSHDLTQNTYRNAYKYWLDEWLDPGKGHPGLVLCVSEVTVEVSVWTFCVCACICMSVYIPVEIGGWGGSHGETQAESFSASVILP